MQSEQRPVAEAKLAPPSPITHALGAFVAGPALDEVPEVALVTAKRGIIDAIGVMIAGSNEAPVQILARTMGSDDRAEAALLTSGRRVAAPLAAWINGTAAHVHDFDDVGVGMRGHPSAVLVSAILAEGQALGRSGREVLDAYVCGYEVWADLVCRDPDYHHLKGWHPTAVFGTVAAAAAAARLRRLDADRARHAIGIAASQAGGLMSNFGSMTKPLHVGQAAQAGSVAARLAAEGFTAAADAIEHPRGFLAALSPAGRVDRSRPVEAGSAWRIAGGLNIKRYPVCYFAHRAIDAMLALREQHELVAEEIERIEAHVSRTHCDLLHSHAPTTVLEAKFSLEFAMAAAVLAGGIGLAELSGGFVSRSDVQSLLRQVHVVVTDETDPDMPGYAPYDYVAVRLKSGQVLLSPQIRRPKGHADQPLSSGEMRQKFLANCAFAGMAGTRAEELLVALEGLENIGNINVLI